jgi:putative transposase
LVKAIRVCFPASIRIRCWFHRLANIRAKLPDESAAEVMAHLYAVRDAPTLDAARAAADRLINTYRREYPAAVGCFEDDLDALLAIHRVPVRHRIRVRTTNLAERSFVEQRRRTKVIGRFSDERSAIARVRHHDPRRRALVPRLDQRPRTPPTQAAARRPRPRPAAGNNQPT